MKSISELSNKAKVQLNLPLGFGFHPTDEELITYYVHKKVIDPNFSTIAIAEVDIHRFEPWDLPGKAKMGEDEWYFYYLRDNKCKTGLRTKRSTEAGYWKSTGKDGEIYKGKCVIGKKKILVFYKGRAPKGEKTNWIMHEYRSEGKSSVQNSSTPIKNEWLIYRVFLKTSGGKKTHISDIRRDECIGNGLTSSSMSLSPPVIGCSPNFMGLIEPCTTSNDSAHVPCFSSMLCDDGNNQVGISNSAGDFLSGITSNPQEVLPRIPFETIQAPMNKALLLDSSVAQQEQNFLDDDFDSQGFVSEMEKIVSASLEMGPTNTDMMNSEISSMILPSFGNQLNSSATSLDLDCF